MEDSGWTIPGRLMEEWMIVELGVRWFVFFLISSFTLLSFASHVYFFACQPIFLFSYKPVV